jgi:hypothetical protein
MNIFVEKSVQNRYPSWGDRILAFRSNEFYGEEKYCVIKKGVR